MTETFENDLDKLREEEEFDGKKISLLIDCLGSGASSFSVVEQEIFVESLKFRKKKNYSSHSTKVSNSSVSKQEEEEANGSEEVEVDENSKEEMEME